MKQGRLDGATYRLAGVLEGWMKAVRRDKTRLSNESKGSECVSYYTTIKYHFNNCKHTRVLVSL